VARKIFSKPERYLMATVLAGENSEGDARVPAVLDDIRATRGTEYINNLWRYLAFDPSLLEETWREVKSVMSIPGELDPLTCEMIYVAVSVANSCNYCVPSHTAAARAQGMTGPQHAELMRVISLAAKTNHLLNAMQVPVDAAFDRDQSASC
jgi:AhpD family alkylhydroperoxidase